MDSTTENFINFFLNQMEGKPSQVGSGKPSLSNGWQSERIKQTNSQEFSYSLLCNLYSSLCNL